MSSRNYSVIKLSHCPSRYGAKQSLTIQTLRQTNTRTVEPDASCCLSPLAHSKIKMPPKRAPTPLSSRDIGCRGQWSLHGHRDPELEMRERSWARSGHSWSGINHSGLRARNVGGQVSPARRVRLISSLSRTLIHIYSVDERDTRAKRIGSPYWFDIG